MKCEDKEVFEKQNAFGMGTPNTAYAQYFIKDSFLNPLTDPKSGLFAANVTFEPGCHNNWHIHHARRRGFFSVPGEGWYQEEGKPAVSLEAGMIIYHRISIGNNIICPISFRTYPPEALYAVSTELVGASMNI